MLPVALTQLSRARITASEPAADPGDIATPPAELAQIKELLSLMAAEAKARERDEVVLEHQRQAFDFMMKQRAELERERNALMALAMEQRKHDDEILKEWIRLI